MPQRRPIGGIGNWRMPKNTMIVGLRKAYRWSVVESEVLNDASETGTKSSLVLASFLIRRVMQIGQDEGEN